MKIMKNENQSSIEDNSVVKPKIPRAGIIYGDTVYWITIVSAFIVLAGSVLTFVTTDNYIDPAYLLSAIWEGKTVDEIWQGAVGQTPDGHWYLSEISTGNGLTAFGIAVGVFSVTPAIIGSAYALFKDQEYFFAGVAFLAAVITIMAMVI